VKNLRQYIEKNRIEMMGDVFIQYHDSPEVTPEKDLDWDAGIPIHGEVRIHEPFRLEKRPGRKWVCAYFEGDPLEIYKSFWIAYALNLAMNGYKVHGYPRVAFRERLAEDQWKLELQWAVRE
jgi:effector-binding domain-containing protein